MPPGHGRAALLDAALALFAERGFEGASTRAIAERAGVPQGLVRHHFGSKEGLFREVVEHALGSSDTPLELTPAWFTKAAGQAAPLIGLLVHALLEPGPRRAWLAEQHLWPLLQREGPRLAGLLGRSPPLAERDLLILVGALIAPLLLAPLTGRGPGSAPASDPAPRLERLLGQAFEALRAPMPEAGPWAPRRPVALPR